MSDIDSSNLDSTSSDACADCASSKSPSQHHINGLRPKQIVHQKREERRKKILKLSQTGKSAGQISKSLGIPETTVRRDLSNGGGGSGGACKPTVNLSHPSVEERRKKVLELNKDGKTAGQILKILKVSLTTILRDLKELKKDGYYVEDNGKKYLESLRENDKWIPIIKRTNEELEFYKKQGLWPTLRKMLYRMLELGVLQKKDYNIYARKTAEARRGIKDDYKTPTNLPRLPIDCFLDDTRSTLGRTDINVPPQDPTPARPPQDWEQYTDEAVDDLKWKILLYNGARHEGAKGRKCGRWYNQPKYLEIWVESETIKPDLEKFQENRKVLVAASGGQITTPYMYSNAKRIVNIIQCYSHVKEVVILYFGDFDKAGNNIAYNHELSLKWYVYNFFGIPKDRVKITFRKIAVTQEQIKKYKLIENPEKKFNVQLEAFLTTDKRLKQFKQIIQDAIDENWDEQVYIENCPAEEFDYEKHGMDEPESINPDAKDPDDPVSSSTIREKMFKKITDTIQPGWGVME